MSGPYCQHDDLTEYTPDGDYREGFWAYCPACGDKWHITHEQRFGKPKRIVQWDDPAEIKF
jgi:hypothetical protein